MKAIKWILIVLIALSTIGYSAFFYLRNETKKASPQETIVYKRNGLEISVTYSRPYKNGREIFGNLVPYGKVWRTGANEPTTFSTNQTINFGGSFLEAGTYSMWTIPDKTQWTVIINSEIPDWGIGWNGKPTRNPQKDVLKVNIASQDLSESVEQFTMEFIYHVNISLKWDKTQLIIPIMYGYDN